MTMITGIATADWKNFLHEFSVRNQGRRTRLEVFTKANVQEEGTEGHLASVELTADGRLLLKRRDESGAAVKDIVDTITDVARLAVQYDTDGSEDALEIEDAQHNLLVLRMESKVDGAS